jgi:NADH dehydrogenase (ubiquinone) Fe-S protein 3
LFITEFSALDNKQNFFLQNNVKNFIENSNILIFYQYYIYNLKLKLTISSYLSIDNRIQSLDCIFKSLGWLERESAEMFKIKIANKTDIRRLLLDYTKNENPLLKDYPTEGYNDVYYCFFNDQVVFSENNTTEL